MTIDGTYKGTAKSLLGSADCKLTLKTNGTTLSGFGSAMGIEAELQNGTVDGESFCCQAEGDSPLGRMTLDIAGTVEGDHISGTIKAGRLTAEFKGDRVQ